MTVEPCWNEGWWRVVEMMKTGRKN